MHVDLTSSALEYVDTARDIEQQKNLTCALADTCPPCATKASCITSCGRTLSSASALGSQP